MYDVVVYGASGFTGRQAAAYLASRGVRLALAGRSREKLEALAGTLGGDVGVLVADSSDPDSVDAAVRRASVVVNTAGPFSRYGDPVVEAAVRHGVDYVDITGETPWVRKIIDRHHAGAQAKATRIVPMCGFDSVPSDLGTWMVARFIRDTWDQPTKEVRAAFSLKGGLNGGTMASALAMAESGSRGMGDPVLLNPEGHRTQAERKATFELRGVQRDPDLGRWLTPFFMAPVNTRVVRRSAALLDEAGEGYGPGFSYWEAMETRSRRTAWGTLAGLATFDQALRKPLGRRIVGKLVPKPGEGPSERQMDEGFFRARLVGTAGDGRKALGIVSDTGDPGNRATVKMLCEAGLALLHDREALPDRCGVLTPATAFGEVLLKRLRAAGMTWEVSPLPAEAQ